MKAKLSVFSCRVLRSLICAAVALCLMLPAFSARAAEESGVKLRTIQTYELLDMLAADHGKVILVNFFASFCGPCKREIPELIQLRKEISPKDLVIIGVSVDQDVRDGAAFVREFGIHKAFPVFHAAEDLVRAYRIDAIPYNVIYNRQGRIEASEAGYVPAADMKNFLLELIRR